jgi:hypothetical protein
MYLAYAENTLQDLQFVVWYQQYRQRFLGLPHELQATSPPPFKTEFSLDTPVSPRSSGPLVPISPISARWEPITPLAPVASTAAVHRASFASGATTAADPRSSSLSSRPLLPFADECARVVATFFRPSAKKELALHADVRDAVVRNLVHSTHPDVFAPAYEEIYASLNATALPRFLASATTNINRPKQLLGVFTGLGLLLLAIVLLFILIFAVPVPPQRNRAYRLLVVIPAAASAYSFALAARGFCPKVGGRGNRQLRAWEMEDVDAGTERWWHALVFPPPLIGASGDEPEDAEDGAAQCLYAAARRDAMVADLVAPPAVSSSSALPKREAFADSVSEVDEDVMTFHTAFHTADGSMRNGADAEKRTVAPAPIRTSAAMLSPTRASFVTVPAPTAINAEDDEIIQRRSRGTQNGFRRPPLFGPEAVVLDPRIRAAHTRIIHEVIAITVITALLTSALVFALPSGA